MTINLFILLGFHQWLLRLYFNLFDSWLRKTVCFFVLLRLRQVFFLFLLNRLGLHFWILDGLFLVRDVDGIAWLALIVMLHVVEEALPPLIHLGLQPTCLRLWLLVGDHWRVQIACLLVESYGSWHFWTLSLRTRLLLIRRIRLRTIKQYLLTIFVQVAHLILQRFYRSNGIIWWLSLLNSSTYLYQLLALEQRLCWLPATVRSRETSMHRRQN